MTYSEEVAEGKIAEYGLRPSTKARWKRRNEIPERFFREQESTLKIMGYNLKECRELLELTQKEVAHQLTEKAKALLGPFSYDIGAQSVSQWEAGFVSPRKDKKKLLLIYYGEKFKVAGVKPKPSRSPIVGTK